MSERWEQLSLLESISFVAASPAKTSAAPVAALASPPEPAPDSGSSSIASSASSRHNGSSLRTSRRGLGVGCPVCGMTCGLGDTEPVHSRFLPPTSGRPNSGYGSSSWATPTASDAKRAALTPGAVQAQSSITQAVCSEIWPTPTASLPDNWGLITEAKADAIRRRGRADGGGTLIEAISCQIWPTPTASDGTQRGVGQAPRPSLSTLARTWPTETATLGRHGEVTGQGGTPGLALNPAFVEALMGFPAGWTVID